MNIFDKASLFFKNLIVPSDDKKEEPDEKSIIQNNSEELTLEPEDIAPVEEGECPPSTENALRPEDEKFIHNLNAIIQRSIPDPDIDVEYLAREMAMSHTIFYERVRRVIGVTPCNLIKKARMERAKELLMEGKLTVCDVADQCGFPNWRYFSTTYKKYWGYSPSQEGRIP